MAPPGFTIDPITSYESLSPEESKAQFKRCFHWYRDDSVDEWLTASKKFKSVTDRLAENPDTAERGSIFARKFFDCFINQPDAYADVGITETFAGGLAGFQLSEERPGRMAERIAPLSGDLNLWHELETNAKAHSRLCR